MHDFSTSKLVGENLQKKMSMRIPDRIIDRGEENTDSRLINSCYFLLELVQFSKKCLSESSQYFPSTGSGQLVTEASGDSRSRS